MSYLDNLINSCIRARSAVPIKEYSLDSISQLQGVRNAIYVIEQVGGDIERTFLALSDYKKLKERACPKLNSPSSVMYVGSSTTDVKKRIEQHLGHGHKDTYALHLKHWFDGEYRILIKEYAEPLGVLQLIEDNLSHNLQPAFGKRGGNSR